jgi:hypothetical protein
MMSAEFSMISEEIRMTKRTQINLRRKHEPVQRILYVGVD